MEVATASPFEIFAASQQQPVAVDSLLLSVVADSLAQTICDNTVIHEVAASLEPHSNHSNGPILTASATTSVSAPPLPKRDIIQRPVAVVASPNSIPPSIALRPAKRFDKLVILDLDGTLVHSEFAARPAKDHHFSLFNDEIFVYKRPGLEVFIRTLLQWFDVAVWTASGCEYAAHIVKNIFPDEGAELSFLFSSSRCTNLYCPHTGERTIIKDLKKAKRKGYDLRKMLIIDDTPSTFRRNYGNAVYIPPYWGTKIDDSLPLLLRYLERIGGSDNVRTVDKRNWMREAVSLLAAEISHSAATLSPRSSPSLIPPTSSFTDLPDASS